MVNCAITKNAGLVIVSRDTDYGVTIGDKSYINDHLRHEFSDRVSQKRKLTLFSRLSDALKTFDVPVSAKEEQVEKDFVSHAVLRPIGRNLYRYGYGVLSDLDGSFTDAQRAYLKTFSQELLTDNLKELLREAGAESPHDDSDEKKES